MADYFVCIIKSMKKAKLITAVSSLSVVSALVPIAATSCSSKDNGIEARMNIYSRAWTSSPTKEYTSILEWTNKEKVNFIDLDQQIQNEINNNWIHHVENLSDSELRSTFTADFKSIYIHP